MAFKDTRLWLGLDRFVWAGLLLLVLLLGGVYLWLDWDEPRPVTVVGPVAGFSANQWEVMREVERIETAYRQIGDEAPPADWTQDMGRAVELQEQLLRSLSAPDPGQSARLERLLALRDTLRARELWPRVQSAEAVLAQSDSPAVQRLAAMTELLAMRREINRSHAAVRFKDLVRETQLAREWEDARAGPLHAAALEALAQARAAMDRRDWVAALSHYGLAREKLEELNRVHPRTKYADLALLKRVRAEEESLQGAAQALEAGVFAAGADAAAAAGQAEEAADRYARAIELQQQVNARWPQSRFFKTLALEEWESRRQTVRAESMLADIAQQDREITRLLAGRQTLEAGWRIARLQGEFVRLEQAHPKHRATVDDLRRKTVYLAALGDTLGALQDEIFDQLLPLPGQGRGLLMRTEVAQSLYQRVMKFNPSRDVGDNRPVDSVTWPEAAEFCRRLGWVLGHTVRMPRPREHDLASSDILAAGDEAGLPGFRQLDDDHAEWLWTTDETDTAPVVAPRTLQTEAEDRWPRSTRRRDLGFRVLVELPVPAP